MLKQTPFTPPIPNRKCNQRQADIPNMTAEVFKRNKRLGKCATIALPTERGPRFIFQADFMRLGQPERVLLFQNEKVIREIVAISPGTYYRCTSTARLHSYMPHTSRVMGRPCTAR